MTYFDERNDLSAADAMEAAATPPRPSKQSRGFWLMVADERGMRPEFTACLTHDVRRFPGELALKLTRASHPEIMVSHALLEVVWVEWAERPGDFTIDGDVLLVKVLGEKGVPPREPAPKRERKKKRHEEEHWDAGSARSYKDRLWDAVHSRRGAAAPVPSPSAEPGPKCGCGIGHTLGSYRALPMLTFMPRQEAFTVITNESRQCSCGAVLHFETKRLVRE